MKVLTPRARAAPQPGRLTELASLDVLQISSSTGEACGIAFFARDLAAEMAHAGVRMSTVRSTRDVAQIPARDVTLVHYHDELLTVDDVRQLRRTVDGPFVLFAHSPPSDLLLDEVDGVITMAPGRSARSERPVLRIAHPAWTPATLVPREQLPRPSGAASGARTVGTTGFLKFDRQLVEVVSALLPYAVNLDWQISVHTSPWRLESPGVLEQLDAFQAVAPQHVLLKHGYLPHDVLNQRLQACDLLWCWTHEPSSPYASGVASCLYASGTRMVVADKLQHHHVLDLPNVMRAPARLDGFVDAVVAEMKRGGSPRHDPGPISWHRQVGKLRSFLRQVAGRGTG